MKYEITNEQILELDNLIAGTNLQVWFPDAFKTELETGKWYKCSADIEFLICYQGNGSDNYGFWGDQPYRNNISFGDYWDDMSRLATPEEVEASLINEAKKRGFVDGVKHNITNGIAILIARGARFYFEKHRNILLFNNWSIFENGKWAEILPQEKTVVPMEKALKIIAKKMKVSPENIEIE